MYWKIGCLMALCLVSVTGAAWARTTPPTGDEEGSVLSAREHLPEARAPQIRGTNHSYNTPEALLAYVIDRKERDEAEGFRIVECCGFGLDGAQPLFRICEERSWNTLEEQLQNLAPSGEIYLVFSLDPT
jgi:hypothetical protein